MFRTGVEVLPIDVTVLDRDGRQVTDLKSEEFQVEVDGKARKVLTSEYIKLLDPLIAGQRRPTFDNRAAASRPRPIPASRATARAARRRGAPSCCSSIRATSASARRAR